MSSRPSTPFTTCDSDAEAVTKLPRVGLDSNTLQGTNAALNSMTREALRWYQGAGVIPTMSNAVVAYIFGRCAFTDIERALATATGAEHRIYLLGWGVDPDTKLFDGSPPVKLRDCLASTKAAVRGMFWDNPLVKSENDPGITSGNNKKIVGFLNNLPNGAAILDHKLPFVRIGGAQTGICAGVHHQKLLVISGSSGLIAFTGGMDINPSRIAVDAGGFGPLHDVHVRIVGPGAIGLLKVFRERWLDHPDSAALDSSKFNLKPGSVTADFDRVARAPNSNTSVPTSTRKSGRRIDGNHAVAVGRTYANLRKFGASEPYSFAPAGEETAWNLVRNGISSARRFLYIEDQYFVSRRIKAALMNKLRDSQFQFLLVLMHNSSSFETANPKETSEFPYLIAARNEIRADFSSIDPERRKWQMFSLRASSDPQRQQWCGTYVHSKTLIADDEFAVIGSTNVDDRGYTFDAEVVVGITDDPLGRAGAQRFARDLRVNLWHKHLSVPQSQLADWASALRFWHNPPPGAMIVDNSELEDSPLLGAKPILREVTQADMQWRESIDPDADRLR